MFSLSTVFAITATAVVLQMMGAAWFMGVIPRLYTVALGREHEPDAAPGLLFIAGPFVCGVMVTVTHSVLLSMVQITELADAFGLGALVGLGFLTPTVFNVAINPNIPHPLLYGAINAPYFVLSSMVACAMLTWLA